MITNKIPQSNGMVLGLLAILSQNRQAIINGSFNLITRVSVGNFDNVVRINEERLNEYYLDKNPMFKIAPRQYYLISQKCIGQGSIANPFHLPKKKAFPDPHHR